MRRPDLSHSEEAYRVLEEQIVTLVIAPGRVMTEHELTVAAGYGRTPVREAIQRLDWDMLVRIFPRRGILIEPIDVPRALMTLDVRARIEPLVMERAARLSDDVERMLFRQLAEEMDASATGGEPLAFTRLDRRFNDLVMQSARHEVAARTVQPLHAVWRRIGYYAATRHPDRVDASAHLHARLARAIAADDQAGIGQILRDLLEMGRKLALSIEAAAQDDAAGHRPRSAAVARHSS
jgi:DNA-binding GntR family transcriptional regulator